MAYEIMEMNPQEQKTQKGLNIYLKATYEAKDNDSDRNKSIFLNFLHVHHCIHRFS